MRTFRLRYIVLILLVVALVCPLVGTASAREGLSLSKTGSITVTMRDPETQEGVPGGTLTLYRVGRVQSWNGNASFVLTEEFAGSSLSLHNVYSPELAQALADYAREAGIAGETRTIGDDGTVAFPDLKTGLYLLVQEEAAEGYNAVSPFLVTLPMRTSSGYVYDVDASPKVELERLPEDPPAENPDTTLPQTGLLNWPVPVLAISGLLLFAAGWLLCFVGRKEHDAE